MSEAVLAAVAFNNPKDILKVVEDIFGGDNPETRHDPHEPSDFEEWDWKRGEPDA